MTKFFTTFACLLLTCSICDANLSMSWLSSNADTSMSVPSPAPTPDCQPTIDNVTACLSFLMSDDNSKPDEGCCSGIKTAATTNIVCLCAIIGSDELTLYRAKALTIPSGCGMKSPFGQCDLPISPAPTPESPVPIQAPLKGSSGSPTPYPEPEPIKSPVPVSAPSVPNRKPEPSPVSSPSVPNRKPEPEPSPVSSPSVPSPKQGTSETPAAPSPSVASTAPAPAPKKSPAAPTAYPISLPVIAISSILFVYFCWGLCR